MCGPLFSVSLLFCFVLWVYVSGSHVRTIDKIFKLNVRLVKVFLRVYEHRIVCLWTMIYSLWKRYEVRHKLYLFIHVYQHVLNCILCTKQQVWLAIAQILLGSSRLDTTRFNACDVSSPCILTVSSSSNSTARLARHVELDSLDMFDTFDTTSPIGATRNLVCYVICIKLWYVSYSLIYWSYIYLIYLIWRNK